MRSCGIFGLGPFGCDSEVEAQPEFQSSRRGNISCVAGLQNMLPSLAGQISDGAAPNCHRLCDSTFWTVLNAAGSSAAPDPGTFVVWTGIRTGAAPVGESGSVSSARCFRTSRTLSHAAVAPLLRSGRRNSEGNILSQ